MFTTCPECGTVFRVTVAVLRAARGQVRCGVCAATFDALLYLSDEVEADEDEAAAGGSDLADTATHSALREHAAGAGEVDAIVDVDDVDDGAQAFDAAAVDDDGAAVTTTRDPAFDLDLQFDETLTPDDVFPVSLPDPHGGDAAPAAPGQEAFPDDVPIEVAAELLVANADALPPPEFPPFEDDAAASTSGLFEKRAGRNTPSADEDRALAEIAASLARGAQDPAARPPEAIDVDILDPAVAARMLAAEGGVPEEIPDSALEFNLPAEQWDRVFVADPETPTIPPLDATLADARASALAAGPDADWNAAAASEPEGDLNVEMDALDLADDELYDDDHGHAEIDADEDDDGDEDARADARTSPASAADTRARTAPDTDPLAQTDTFPPLAVSAAEEASAGLADTPAAQPYRSIGAAVLASGPGASATSTAPAQGAAPSTAPVQDFDALVAAAAARAAAEVAARVTPALVAQHVGAAQGAPGIAAAPTVAREAESANAAAAPIAPTPAEAPDWIQFDAKRFHAMARGDADRPWWATALLAAGSIVLALGLAAQIVHYYRDSLAQHPVAGAPLRELYARLGLPLEPEWNLAGYELKQWGAATDAEPGTLRVRASVVNRATRGQPYPLLRVTLEDRFGGRLARREFTPAEYLPGRAPPAQLLPAGDRIDADLLIADPGSDAVGFELDVCLPRRGALTCAGDIRRSAP